VLEEVHRSAIRERSLNSGTGTMYGISVRREQLRSSSLGGRRRHGKKCHIILLYGDTARRSLRKFILLHETRRARRGSWEGSIAYTVLWELRNSATGAPGMDSESPYVSPFVGDIFARVAYERHFRALYEGGRHEVEFISG